MRFPAIHVAVVTSVLSSCLLGCGSSEQFTVAPVRDKVLCSGKPVGEGIVQFAPVSAEAPSGNKASRPGKSGAGQINADGTFEISTYEMGDGAVIGKCRVIAGPSDPTRPWACKLPGPIEFEVKPGVNSIVIQLEGSKGTIASDL